MRRLNRILSVVTAAVMLVMTVAVNAQERKLHVVSTGDVHGAWFNKNYINGAGERNSLMSVKYYLDNLRAEAGEENVLLLDAGDCLQGDNAAYYYNYVDTTSVHLFSRLVSYMGYDAIVAGNHDIETGHRVYDRVDAELAEAGIPLLAANAVRNDSGEPYFQPYAMFKKAGLNVAVLGFDNANIKAWLSESLWSGMHFVSLIPCVQKWVDSVVDRHNPDVVIVVVHSGTGKGDGSVIESQGLDLLHSLRGVDLVIAAHDHAPYTVKYGKSALMNGGAKASNVSHAVITADMRKGKVKSKSVDVKVVRMNKRNIDTAMAAHFEEDYNKVREFTNRKVGSLAMDMFTRDAYKGMSDYTNLVHTVQLSVPEAQISFAAPLTFNGRVKAGELVFNDMFTIYPFENQLFVVRMKGREIKKYLEFSYNNWIQTPGEHVLRIKSTPDPRTNSPRWSFVGRPYNFDSAAGLIYTVDVTKQAGERVNIISLADGSAFEMDKEYNVAMTSYRANGGGQLIPLGAGIKDVEAEGRVVARYPEIRDMIYNFVLKVGNLDKENTGDRKLLGQWSFIPAEIADPMIEADMNLIF